LAEDLEDSGEPNKMIWTPRSQTFKIILRERHFNLKFVSAFEQFLLFTVTGRQNAGNQAGVKLNVDKTLGNHSDKNKQTSNINLQ
jgi:hypothetical protein